MSVHCLKVLIWLGEIVIVSFYVACFNYGFTKAVKACFRGFLKEFFSLKNYVRESIFNGYDKTSK